tara:strand:- start:104 stop:886 length:783 start_codon:yes stop_codon:yes gene_type:complete
MAAGWVIAVSELSLYFLFSNKIRKYYRELQTMNVVIYYWLTMTVLTMIWECSFVYQYKSINAFSQELIETKTHVWTNDYQWYYVLPWKTAYIFYGEYGAYADREYMVSANDWSRVIESSHAMFCGVGAMLVLYQKIINDFYTTKDMKYSIKYSNTNLDKYYLAMGVSMGSQLMNSVLYMANYFVQIQDQYNINYCSREFPCRFALLSRAFMYVNVFWTVLPLYAIVYTWNNCNKIWMRFSLETENSRSPKQEWRPIDQDE